jgi:dimethylargininase
MVNGITSASLGNPDYDLALAQHVDYIKALEACSLDVTVLPADESFPDSTFVEDAALLTPHCAIITRPGAASRRGETGSIRQALSTFYSELETIAAPGTLDAGDVMMVGKHFHIGLSERTNTEGASQLIAILEKHGMSGSVIELEEVLHLKTGVNYLENNKMLACGEFLEKPEFSEFEVLQVSPDEAYAANSLWVNGAVLVPAGHPKTRSMISAAGYPTLEVNVSEFQKLDGGLSCLSLRF